VPFAGGLTGCTGPFVPDRNVVRVAVSWSAAELTAFRAVLDSVLRGGSPASYEVEPISLGDDIEAAFGSRGVDRPDVVMLPRAGLVREHLDELAPIPDLYWVSSSFHPSWERLLFHRPPNSSGAKKPFGLPFKAAHKSAIWYDRTHLRSLATGRAASRPGTGRAVGADAKPSLPRLIGQVHRMAEEHRAGRSERAPLALGGADGWTLTDLFENVLLALDPEVYTDLARQGDSDDPDQVRPWARVRPALLRLAELWGAAGSLSGGVGTCLSMQFPDAVLDVFYYRRAAMVVAPDFAEPIVRTAIRRGRISVDDVGVLRFPAAGDNPPPLIAGGDVMVLTRPAGDNAKDLVGRLADPSAPTPWIRRGGFIPANLHGDVDADYSPMAGSLAKDLRRREERRYFDLSDQIGAVGGRAGLWRALQDFLIATGDRFEDPGSAESRATIRHEADAAIDHLIAFERERRAT